MNEEVPAMTVMRIDLIKTIPLEFKKTQTASRIDKYTDLGSEITPMKAAVRHSVLDDETRC